MSSLDTVFAAAVVVLAAVAVLAVLAFIVVWAVLGIRRELAEHRARTIVPPFDPSARYWPEHSAVRVVDGITDDERDQVRRMADQVLAGDTVQEAAKETAT
jgi:hypothetical protein